MKIFWIWWAFQSFFVSLLLDKTMMSHGRPNPQRDLGEVMASGETKVLYVATVFYRSQTKAPERLRADKEYLCHSITEPEGRHLLGMAKQQVPG